MADEYTRGEMDISEHKATFDGVMQVSVFSALIIGIAILYLTLVFGGGIGWINALIVSAIVGVAGGVAMKQGALYWVSMAVMAVIAVIAGALVSMLG
jgi:hypothetical protein